LEDSVSWWDVVGEELAGGVGIAHVFWPFFALQITFG
jgi:hypothetical protein